MKLSLSICHYFYKKYFKLNNKTQPIVTIFYFILFFNDEKLLNFFQQLGQRVHRHIIHKLVSNRWGRVFHPDYTF